MKKILIIILFSILVIGCTKNEISKQKGPYFSKDWLEIWDNGLDPESHKYKTIIDLNVCLKEDISIEISKIALKNLKGNNKYKIKNIYEDKKNNIWIIEYAKNNLTIKIFIDKNTCEILKIQE